jgi:hypothetical protein
LQTPAGNSPDLSAAAMAHLQQGNKIEAIKQLRVEQGLSLFDAKALVDRYVDLHPELHQSMSEAQKGSVGRFLFGLAFAAILAVLAYLWLNRS